MKNLMRLLVIGFMIAMLSGCAVHHFGRKIYVVRSEPQGKVVFGENGVPETAPPSSLYMVGRIWNRSTSTYVAHLGDGNLAGRFEVCWSCTRAEAWNPNCTKWQALGKDPVEVQPGAKSPFLRVRGGMNYLIPVDYTMPNGRDGTYTVNLRVNLGSQDQIFMGEAVDWYVDLRQPDHIFNHW